MDVCLLVSMGVYLCARVLVGVCVRVCCCVGVCDSQNVRKSVCLCG